MPKTSTKAEADKELSQVPEVGDDAPEWQPIKATWPDGDEWEVPMVTKAAWRDISKPRSKQQEQPLWKSSHVVTNNTVWMAQRTDRSLLLSVYDQGRQIGQVRVDTFGELPEPQPAVVARNHPALMKAVDFFKPLAEAYSKGEIKDKEELKAQRDKLLKELGVKLKGNLRKRPAASPDAGLQTPPAAGLQSPLGAKRKKASGGAGLQTPLDAGLQTPLGAATASSGAAASSGAGYWAPPRTAPPAVLDYNIMKQMPRSIEEEVESIPHLDNPNLNSFIENTDV